MKVLFIAPLPPPISGHTLASKVLYDELIKNDEVEVVDLRQETLNDGVFSLDRMLKTLKNLNKVWRKNRSSDIIYLTISQSVVGNIKDLCIYLICFKKLNRLIIHLHGGGFGKSILNKYKMLRILNSFFLRRIGGAIVLGESHISIFDEILPKKRIHVVPNFAENYLFSSIEEIHNKFRLQKPLNILFLSNLILGKGHIELVDAYLSLDPALQELITIQFAGEFKLKTERFKFLEKIKDVRHLQHHGFVSGSKKKELLEKAHVFCLPTYYRNEGQPISILEAYASGCVVVTTNHNGINDVFEDGLNGFQVEKKSVESLISVLKKILLNNEILLPIGIHNRNIASEKFRTCIYGDSIKKLMINLV